MRYHLILVGMAVTKKTRNSTLLVRLWRKKELCSLLGECKWCMLLKNSWETELPRDPIVPLLGIYPKEIGKLRKDACVPMFIAVLSVMVQMPEPTRVFIDGWMDMYIEMLCSHKKWNLRIYDNVDGPQGHYAEWNKVKERQIPLSLLKVNCAEEGGKPSS